MRKLLLLFIAFLLFPSLSHAAIAHDADANAGTVGTATTFTWSHTCTGSNLILAVRITTRSNGGGGSGHPTSVTYNTVALTEGPNISPSGGTSPSFTYTGIWYLKAPATGSHTVSVTISEAGTSGFTFGSSSSFSGVDQTTPIDNSGVTAANSSTSVPTLSITTVAANAWIVDGLGYYEFSNSNETPTSPQVQDYQSGTSLDLKLASSYKGPIAVPAATTDSWASIGTWQLVALSLKPAAGGGSPVQRTSPAGMMQ